MLTDEQKMAKHDFAMHQDNLHWSRVQFIVTIQSAVLVGTYYLKKEIWLAVALTTLGTVLSFLVFLLMRRDDELGEKAFEESGVPKTMIGPRWAKGRHFAYLSILILVAADWALLWYVAARG